MNDMQILDGDIEGTHTNEIGTIEVRDDHFAYCNPLVTNGGPERKIIRFDQVQGLEIQPEELELHSLHGKIGWKNASNAGLGLAGRLLGILWGVRARRQACESVCFIVYLEDGRYFKAIAEVTVYKQIEALID